MLAPFPLLALALGPLGIAWLALPLCLWLAWRCLGMPADRKMNLLLARTAQAQLLLGVLVTLQLLLS